MKVVVTGANGAVGRAILRFKPRDGLTAATMVAAVRSERAAEQLSSQLTNPGEVVRISYDDPRSLDAALEGATAVIHLAGVLFEKPDSSYDQANVASTQSMIEAAKRNGVQKFVLVSATGADENSSNRYYRTKGKAEALVRASGLRYTVLRVPLLLGPKTAGAAALKGNASRGKTTLIGGGRNLQQPLFVDDLAWAAIAAATGTVADNLTLDLVGPESLRERELVERAARSLGRKVHIGSMPKSLLSVALAIRGLFGNPPFSRDVLEVITADTRIDPEPAAGKIGIQLTGIDEMIRTSLAEG